MPCTLEMCVALVEDKISRPRSQPPDRAPLRRYGSYNSPAARRALSEVSDTSVAQRSVPTSRVTFRVQYHVPFGQNIRVIGSHASLGAHSGFPVRRKCTALGKACLASRQCPQYIRRRLHRGVK